MLRGCSVANAGSEYDGHHPVEQREVTLNTPTTSTLSQLNRGAIVEALRAHGPLSRPQIVEHTGLSAATISRLTTQLIADKRVVEDGVAPSTGGRPSVMLRYSGASRLVAAVKVAEHAFVGALVDFDGLVIERFTVETDFARDAAAAGFGPAPVIRKLVNRLMRAADKRGTPCLAVGISVPFAVTPDGQMVGTDDDAAWEGLTSSELVDPRLAIPVLIENDANALALGELRHGVGRHSPHFAVILLASGLGAGLVTNGALYRGSRSAAGEIGYLMLGDQLLGDLHGEKQQHRGDLEARLGSVALRATAQRRGLAVASDAEASVAQILLLARGGNQVAAEIAAEILDIIARAVAAISSVLDPEFVVLGEGLSDHADFIIPQLHQRLNGRIFRVPRLESAALGADAVLLGAAEMAMRAVTPSAQLLA